MGSIKKIATSLGQACPSAITDAEKAGFMMVSPENYKLSLAHFKAAISISTDEHIEEIQKVAASLRGPNPVPTVGNVYGLAALSGGDSIGIASDGTVAVIECVCNPYARRGRAVIIGSEVANSVKEIAEHAKVFLNEQCDWRLEITNFS